MQAQNENDPRPVMGILVKSRNQIGSYRNHIMNEANKEVKNTLFYFSLDQVRLRERKISGYFWDNRQKSWFRKEFSFPDILYLRGGIDKRYSQTFTALCGMINRNNGTIITHNRFNKWRLYQVMQKDPAIKNYLPVTRTAMQPVDLSMMLQKYRVVYLKSHIGGMGEHVLKVEALPRGAYRYSFYQFQALTVNTVPDFQSLLNVVKQFYRGKNFLIQQAISLPKYRNRLIDMRAELQRNGDGALEIAGISVRCGRLGSPITTHGEAFRFDQFFVKKMGYSKERMASLRDAVQEFLFNIYEYIDQNYSEYAEIGIDFAIDTNNRIWFIEANSQSTKVSLNKAYGLPVLFKNYKTILEYAGYLFNRANKDVKHYR